MGYRYSDAPHARPAWRGSLLLFASAITAALIGPGVQGGVVGVGFTPAAPEAFRFVTAIGRQGRAPGQGIDFYCTGSLIGRSQVITAAHCMIDDEGKVVEPKSIIVVIGVADLTNLSVRSMHAVAKVAVNPGYDRETLRNDVAVITLTKPSSEKAALVVLEETPPPPGTAMEVAGYGAEQEGAVSARRTSKAGVVLRAHQPRLGMATIPLVARQPCQSALDTVKDDVNFSGLSVDDSQICAGRSKNSPDSCQGDSGGPLLTRDATGRARLWGLVSFGVGCGRDGFYGVYTRLGAQRKWLKKQLLP